MRGETSRPSIAAAFAAHPLTRSLPEERLRTSIAMKEFWPPMQVGLRCTKSKQTPDPPTQPPETATAVS
jgi:hypothetical protein